MSLVTINADLNRLAVVLERIAAALDRAFPVLTLPTYPAEPYGPEALTTITDEQQWEMEQQEEAQRSLLRE